MNIEISKKKIFEKHLSIIIHSKKNEEKSEKHHNTAKKITMRVEIFKKKRNKT